jgi:hypothetical protein
MPARIGTRTAWMAMALYAVLQTSSNAECFQLLDPREAFFIPVRVPDTSAPCLILTCWKLSRPAVRRPFLATTSCIYLCLFECLYVYIPGSLCHPAAAWPKRSYSWSRECKRQVSAGLLQNARDLLDIHNVYISICL